MDNIPITCLACNLSLPEKDYMKHMETVHGGARQQDAISQKKAIEQNTPVDNLPAGVKPEDLPDQSFLETLAEMQKAEQEARKPQPEPQKPVVEHPVASQTPSTPKVLTLRYKYEGKHDCGNEVKTIMIATGLLPVWHAIAYCINCDKNVNQLTVEPIPTFPYDENHKVKKIQDALPSVDEFYGNSLISEEEIKQQKEENRKRSEYIDQKKKVGRPKKV